jgi:hypothetical protein
MGFNVERALTGSWIRPGPLERRETIKQLSRRFALFSAAIFPAVAMSRYAGSAEADPVLLALGRRFDAITAQLDHAIEHGLSVEWQALEEFGQIETQIFATPATTLEGFCVKARVGCWALLGDFDSADQSADGARMAFSITRDLIRLHAPHLERPGALKKLVREIEEGAKKTKTQP